MFSNRKCDCETSMSTHLLEAEVKLRLHRVSFPVPVQCLIVINFILRREGKERRGKRRKGKRRKGKRRKGKEKEEKEDHGYDVGYERI